MKRNSYLNKEFKNSTLLNLIDFVKSLNDGWELHIVCNQNKNHEINPFGFAVLHNVPCESIIIAEIYGIHRLQREEYIGTAKTENDIHSIFEILDVYSGKMSEDDLWERKFADFFEPKKEAHKVL